MATSSSDQSAVMPRRRSSVFCRKTCVIASTDAHICVLCFLFSAGDKQYGAVVGIWRYVPTQVRIYVRVDREADDLPRVPLLEDDDTPRLKCWICLCVSRSDDDMPPGSPEVRISVRTLSVCRDIHP